MSLRAPALPFSDPRKLQAHQQSPGQRPSSPVPGVVTQRRQLHRHLLRLTLEAHLQDAAPIVLGKRPRDRRRSLPSRSPARTIPVFAHHHRRPFRRGHPQPVEPHLLARPPPSATTHPPAGQRLPRRSASPAPQALPARSGPRSPGPRGGRSRLPRAPRRSPASRARAATWELPRSRTRKDPALRVAVGHPRPSPSHCPESPVPSPPGSSALPRRRRASPTPVRAAPSVPSSPRPRARSSTSARSRGPRRGTRSSPPWARSPGPGSSEDVIRSKGPAAESDPVEVEAQVLKLRGRAPGEIHRRVPGARREGQQLDLGRRPQLVGSPIPGRPGRPAAGRRCPEEKLGRRGSARCRSRLAPALRCRFTLGVT